MTVKILAIIIAVSAVWFTSCSAAADVKLNAVESITTPETAIQPISETEETILPVKAPEVSPKANLTQEEIERAADSYLDIIVAGTECFYPEKKLIDAHPDEFAALVALGGEAVPYLTAVGDMVHSAGTNQEKLYRSIIAMAAAYSIEPELYDLSIPSPDGRYTAKISVADFSSMLSRYIQKNGTKLAFCPDEPELSYKFQIIDNKTGSVDSELPFYCYDLKVEWSSDSRYMVISTGSAHIAGSNIFVYDAKKITCDRVFYDFNEQIALIAEKLPYFSIASTDNRSYYNLGYEGWLTDSKIKLNLIIKYNNQYAYKTKFKVCSFTYDIAEKKAEDIIMNTESAVSDNLDVIVNHSIYNSTTQQLEKDNPEEFGRLVALGEAALPYLAEAAGKLNTDSASQKAQLSSLLAMEAAYTINPDIYDLKYPSPDGKYILKATVNSFSSAINPYRGIDFNVSTTSAKADVAADGIFNNLTMEWSKDSKYAAVTQSYRSFYSTTSVFDATASEFIRLPDKDEIEAFGNCTLMASDSDGDKFTYLHLLFGGFENDTVRINMRLYSATGKKLDIGYYIYSLSKRSLAEVHFTNPEENPDDDTAESIETIIGRDLDIIANVYYFESEKELIDANPYEFGQIVSLGEKALPYLKEAGSQKYISFSEQAHVMTALYAANTIKPELYNIDYPSPDGKYLLRFSVNTFTTIMDSLTGIIYDLSVIDCGTDEVLITGKGYSNVEAEWSADSRYVQFRFGHMRYVMTVSVYDVANNQILEVPIDEIRDTIVRELKLDSNFSFYSIHQNVAEWVSPDTIKINLFLVASCAPVDKSLYTVTVSYNYNLTDFKISELEYTPEYYYADDSAG